MTELVIESSIGLSIQYLPEEPPSGSIIRLRRNNHHTLGFIYTRDDTETHERKDTYWWCHDESSWFQWPEILKQLARPDVVFEILRPPPLDKWCRPDGPHSDSACRPPLRSV